MPRTERHLDPGKQNMDLADIQTLPSPSDKRPSTGHTVDLVAHHVLSSGKSQSERDSVPGAFLLSVAEADG
jgi:hypothetical protein